MKNSIRLFVSLFLICLCVAPSAQAQRDTRQLVQEKPATPNAQKRFALVIGNAAYTKTAPLANPVNDANDVAATLKTLGFEVFAGTNQTKRGMERLIRDYVAKIEETKGVGLFFYAGHGLQLGGNNFLVPVDADIPSEDEIEYAAVNLNFLLGKLDYAGNSLNIVILDACRDNPFARQWRGARDIGVNGGLASVSKAPTGTLIAYATAPGSVAFDGRGKNGLYTSVLLEEMRKPDLELLQVFENVRVQVRRKSQGKQTPWESSSKEGSFYFARANASSSAAAVATAKTPILDAPINNAPVKNAANAAAVRSAGAITKSRLPNGAEMSFAYIPAGEFQMGSTRGEKDEKPVHRVKISQGFWMGQTEVTQAQWEALMENNPSRFKNCPQCPVEQVTWDDAQQFIARLNAQDDGYKYRLPTEAEWEYAARVAMMGEFLPGEVDLMAWYDQNANSKTHEVGTKQSNGWNLFDMNGNVWEWTADFKGDYQSGAVTDPTGAATGSQRVVRGGFTGSAGGVRSTLRGGNAPGNRYAIVGFRVVRF